MYESSLGSWSDFTSHRLLDLIDPPPESDLLFRGQSNEKWGLVPSLLRAIGAATSKEPERALALEELAREEFAAQAHLFLPSAVLTSNTSRVRWWTVMQHYGAPTRMLDWTFSPYVAAYMACKSNFDNNGAIWALNVQCKDFHMPDEFNEEDKSNADNIFLDPEADPSSLRLLVHGLRNERMIAQQGVFIFSDQILSDHRHELSRLQAPNRRRWTFGKLIIPAEHKLEYLKRLSTMNVNARSLFPGADGLGQSIREGVMMSAIRRDPNS